MGSGLVRARNNNGIIIFTKCLLFNLYTQSYLTGYLEFAYNIISYSMHNSFVYSGSEQ